MFVGRIWAGLARRFSVVCVKKYFESFEHEKREFSYIMRELQNVF